MSASTTDEPRCKIHMLWNWETVDTCIVFRSWHAYNMAQFVISCLIIVFIGVAFEWLRKVQKSYDAKLAKGGDPGPGVKRLGLTPRLIRALIYSCLVFISFFIMLIFMTYNGYLVLSVVLGAFIGHYLLNEELAVDESGGGAIGSNGMACH